MKVLIVDDEPLARELLQNYIRKMQGIELTGVCANALEAFAVLNRQAVDLLLLDINMPEINGMDFIRALKTPPKVIFTTAYSEFAVESYNLNALDYLLKPITFDRFIKAVNKATDLINKERELSTETKASLAPGADTLLFIKSEGKMVKIDLKELWFVEGLKNYIRLWTDHGKIIVHSTMQNFEDQLKDHPFFIRINKSFIVNLNYVSEIEGNIMRVKGEMLTVGNTYRDDLLKIIDKHKFE